MTKASVIGFQTKSNKQRKARKSGDGFKYLTDLQIKLLRRTARDAAQLALQKGQVTAVREWVLLDLLTCIGLRFAQAADSRCGDILPGYGQCACYVRDKARTIEIPSSLRAHLKTFLAWKQTRGEPTGQDDHLFIGQRGPWTPKSRFKRYLHSLLSG